MPIPIKIFREWVQHKKNEGSCAAGMGYLFVGLGIKKRCLTNGHDAMCVLNFTFEWKARL